MRTMLLIFIALLIAVPLAELYVIFQVAHDELGHRRIPAKEQMISRYRMLDSWLRIAG